MATGSSISSVCTMNCDIKNYNSSPYQKLVYLPYSCAMVSTHVHLCQTPFLKN